MPTAPLVRETTLLLGVVEKPLPEITNDVAESGTLFAGVAETTGSKVAIITGAPEETPLTATTPVI